MMTKGSESEFKAAASLLERLWFVEPDMLNAEHHAIDWDAIGRAELTLSISEGERVLLEGARLVWSDREAPSLLARAMRTLDDSSWAAFMAALELKRPVLRVGAASRRLTTTKEARV